MVTTMMQRFIVIDYIKLATYLADEEFKEEFEDVHPFRELYEQVDDTDNWYLREPYASIYEAIQEEWVDILLEFEKEREATIIHQN